MTTYLSTTEILERQTLRTAAEAKAASDPATLTDDDIRNLGNDQRAGEIVSDLVTRGQLVHLGLGARRSPPRRTR